MNVFLVLCFFFFKQKTAYEIMPSLVGSEMCIRDRVTITHPEMTRYFMLISEAVDLVLQAAAFKNGNALYVLEMGKPVRIVDLAEQMISLMVPGEDIDVIFTGLRPGEKLHEQLIDKYESRTSTDHAMIYQVSAMDQQPSILADLPSLFYKAKSHDGVAIKAFLEKWIPSYSPFDMRLVGSINTGDQKVADGAAPASSVVGTIGYHWNNGEKSRFYNDRPDTESG